MEEVNTEEWQFDHQRSFDNEFKPHEFIMSDMFEDDCRNEYETKTQAKLAEGKWFTLIDSLEDCVDMWHYGHSFFGRIPLHNIYIPVKHTIMPKPNLVDKQYDDLQFRYGRDTYDGLKIDPTSEYNPLQTYKMTGLNQKRRILGDQHGKQFYKYRRLSHLKRQPRGFATLVPQPEKLEAPMPNLAMWHPF
jgi:hypothetical protein